MTQDEAGDERAIRQLTDEWLAAAAAKNVARLLALVTDDCVFLAAGMPPVRGKAAVESMYRGIFAQFDVRQASRAEEVRVGGEWAYSWGTDVLEFTPAGGGPATRLAGYGMTVLARQPDGTWRYARGINNVTPASRGAPPERHDAPDGPASRHHSDAGTTGGTRAD